MQPPFDPSRIREVDFPLTHAIPLAPRAGIFAEFGVAAEWRGSSVGTLQALAVARKTIGFDTFDGLPEQWTRGGGSFPKGKFAQREIPRLKNAVLVVGLFEETCPLVDCLVALCHVDCDLYSSTVTALRWLGSRFVPGCVVVFDEFYGYEGCEAHEQKALRESGLSYEWLFRGRSLASGAAEVVAIRLT